MTTAPHVPVLLDEVIAAFAPLDEGVPSQGQVAIDTKRKPVQHLTGGIIKEVLVGEGDLVKEGQLLIKLDDATAKANFEAIRQRYLGLRAMQGRAERWKREIPPPTNAARRRAVASAPPSRKGPTPSPAIHPSPHRV